MKLHIVHKIVSLKHANWLKFGVQLPTLELTGNVTLGKLFNLFKPQIFPIYSKGI